MRHVLVLFLIYLHSAGVFISDLISLIFKNNISLLKYGL